MPSQNRSARAGNNAISSSSRRRAHARASSGGANDLPLFAEADESYATAGASDEVKAAATAVLEPGEDAVVRFLAETVANRAEV